MAFFGFTTLVFGVCSVVLLQLPKIEEAYIASNTLQSSIWSPNPKLVATKKLK